MDKRWSDNRKILKDILPLETPLCINIEASSMCNFKCFYCCQSSNPAKEKEIMSPETFDNIILGAKGFNGTFKSVRFAALGEPLINKNLPFMIEKIKPYTDEVCLFTNGSLLTKDLSNALIRAGLDKLRISLQGYTAEQYRIVSGYNIDYDKFKENISYINSIKGNCKIYIKMLDISLNNNYNENSFIDEFKDICDYTIIENVTPSFNSVDYSKFNKIFDKTVTGYSVVPIKICPQPFFQLTINASGTVSACCADENESLVVGNVNYSPLNKLWEGEKINDIRRSFLFDHIKDTCRNCSHIRFAVSPQDNIDSIKEKLAKRYNG